MSGPRCRVYHPDGWIDVYTLRPARVDFPPQNLLESQTLFGSYTPAHWEFAYRTHESERRERATTDAGNDLVWDPGPLWICKWRERAERLTKIERDLDEARIDASHATTDENRAAVLDAAIRRAVFALSALRGER